MLPSRCTYCGALAENPSRLSWAVADETGAVVSGAVPLCLSCSALWCPDATADEPVCVEADEAR